MSAPEVSAARSAPEVLVVGAGPTGLTLACTLHAAGVPCRVVEARPRPATAPKALVLWSGALEVLRRLGVADDVAAEALPLTGASYWSAGRRLGGIPFGGASSPLVGTAFPGPLCLPQPAVERLLARRLIELGGRVEWGTGVTVAAGYPTTGEVLLRHPDGSAETVAPRHLVGADGTRSLVREGLGLSFSGRTYERTFLLGDGTVTAAGGGETVPPGETQYHLSPDGVLVLVPLPGGGHRVFADVPAVTGDLPAPTDAELQALLDARGPGGLRLSGSWWTSRFRVSAKVASSFRAGSGFVAGDAAHCHSPAGGQGLNTGVQDGFDLGWKLAAVARGVDAGLLDSYTAERRPAALRAVRASDRQTRLWLLRSGAAQRLRDGALARASRRGALERRIVPRLAQLDIDLAASPAVGDLRGAAAVPRAVRLGRRMPDTVLVAGGPGTPAALHEVLARGRHVLLAAGPGARAATAEAAATLTARGAADVVDVVLLQLAAAPGERVAPAPEGVLGVREAGDGAGLAAGGDSWLVLVRPDGVVGLRSGLAGLDAALDRLPSRPAPRAAERSGTSPGGRRTVGLGAA